MLEIDKLTRLEAIAYMSKIMTYPFSEERICPCINPLY